MNVEVAQPLFDAIDLAAKTQMSNVTTVMSVMGGVVGIFWMIYILMKSIYWYFDGLTVWHLEKPNQSLISQIKLSKTDLLP